MRDERYSNADDLIFFQQSSTTIIIILVFASVNVIIFISL